MLELATGPGFFKVELDRAIALVDDAVDVKQIDEERAREQLEAAKAELAKVEAGESTADRWQLEQRILHAENQLAVAGRSLATMRVAALADAHGNPTALEAVLAEVEREQPDLIVSCGDLTWGPLPGETLALLDPGATACSSCAGTRERELVEHKLLDSEVARWEHVQHEQEGCASTCTARASCGRRRRRARPDPLLPRLAAQRRGVRDRGDSGRARGRVHDGCS